MHLTGTKKIMGGLALAGTMLLTGVVGFAQQETPQGGKEHGGGHNRGERRGGMRGDRDGFGGPFSKLNLTDAQKEQMKQIAARFHENAKARRGQERGERRRGDFGAFNGTFDEAAVRAAAQARANAHVEMEVAHARMMSEMFNVLTAEQKAQFAAERQQREQKRQEHRGRRGENPGQRM
ncbi:MAG: Spy/CpxP family protein refolding chaperone [Acidobacteria bacterium]|nr:Spy/CpxP family protein refolding chaperone [Acidobacteriota bacterium]